MCKLCNTKIEYILVRILMYQFLLQFKCCGNAGYTDYTTVPASCCGYTDRSQTCEAAIYTQRPGCQAEFVDFWASNTDIIRWSSLIIALFELGIFIMSCCLASAMRKR